MVQVSFIVPALNEEKNIGNCITSIHRYIPKRISYEVLVGDHGSLDRTSDIARANGAVVYQVKGGTVGYLRNFLVEKSSGKILVFIDADVTLAREWGQASLDVLSDLSSNKRQITGSKCSVPDIKNYLFKCWFSKIRESEGNYLGTGHMIVARDGFNEIGGFDVSLRSGEDYDFCSRARGAGYQINFRPELKVFHHDYPVDMASFVKREIWHGSGDFQSLARFIQSKVAVSSLVFASINGLLLISIFYSFTLFCVGVIALLGMLAFSSVFKFKRLSFVERAVNIFIFYFYYLGRGLAFFKR